MYLPPLAPRGGAAACRGRHPLPADGCLACWPVPPRIYDSLSLHGAAAEEEDNKERQGERQQEQFS